MNDLVINKSNWSQITLGELADDISQRVSNPDGSEYKRFVGLEHFVSGDIKISKYSGTKGLVSAGKAFQAGDILFARRNAYLRRASIVNFDGVCSGDAFVLRENKAKLIPGFLSYIVNSNSLWDFANSNAAGTMSKRVKWRDLAEYQIILPPIDEQSKLDKLLKSCDEVVGKHRNLQEKIERFYSATREKLMLEVDDNCSTEFNIKLKNNINKNICFTTVSDHVVNIKYGTSKKATKDLSGYEVLGIPNVVNERLSLDRLSRVDLSQNEYESIRLSYGDIVIVRTNGNPEYTGRSAIYNIDEGHVFASYLIKLRLDENVFDPEFVVRYLQCNVVRRYFRRHATSSAGNYNINTETIKNLPIPQFEINKQRDIVKQLKEIEHTIDQVKDHRTNSELLLNQLINKVF